MWYNVGNRFKSAVKLAASKETKVEIFSTIQMLIKTFNWHTPSWDLFILLFWLVASVIYAFSSGRSRILTILISVYMAQLLVIEMPFLGEVVSDKLNVATGTLQQLAAFVILFIILFIFLGRYAFKSSADGREFKAIGFGLLFSFFQVGLLINIVLGYLPDYVQNTFSPLVTYIFLHEYSNFIWLALPVVFLVVIGRFISDRRED
ncbi:hypothetical protein IPM19_00385 [bacterium]|nr:MAG: hypothetical protein IPM19_00385 [bacterium]